MRKKKIPLLQVFFLMDKEAFKKLHVTTILFQSVRLAYIEASIYIIFFPMLEVEPRALHIERQTLYH